MPPPGPASSPGPRRPRTGRRTSLQTRPLPHQQPPRPRRRGPFRRPRRRHPGCSGTIHGRGPGSARPGEPRATR
eukprot:4094462-Alexandrium_andersonii.AAC.1